MKIYKKARTGELFRNYYQPILFLYVTVATIWHIPNKTIGKFFGQKKTPHLVWYGVCPDFIHHFWKVVDDLFRHVKIKPRPSSATSDQPSVCYIGRKNTNCDLLDPTDNAYIC